MVFILFADRAASTTSSTNLCPSPLNPGCDFKDQIFQMIGDQQHQWFQVPRDVRFSTKQCEIMSGTRFIDDRLGQVTITPQNGGVNSYPSNK